MSRVLMGNLDGVSHGSIEGWAWDPLCPDAVVEVDLYQDGDFLGTFPADRYRADLERCGVGDGRHHFLVPHRRNTPREVVARFSATGRALPRSPWSSAPAPRLDPGAEIPELRLHPGNVAECAAGMRDVRVGYLLVDTNDTCNARCIYCPNPRSKARIELADFEQLLAGAIAEIDVFQLGCGQEPTLDPRLYEVLEVLSRSRARPRTVQMITNGMLLHRFDAKRLRAEGLALLLLSLDTADPALTRRLRPGTDLEEIVANVRGFRDACPDIALALSVVVSSATMSGIEELLELGRSLGASYFYLREVFDYAAPDLLGRTDYLGAISELLLRPGELDALSTRLQSHWAYPMLELHPAEHQDGAQRRMQLPVLRDGVERGPT